MMEKYWRNEDLGSMQRKVDLRSFLRQRELAIELELGPKFKKQLPQLSQE